MTILRAIKPSLVACLLLLPFTALAQSPDSTTPASQQQLLKSEELDALVAPVALYPDTLLSLVLMASTYPLEVVQADRWASQNKALKEDQLKAAVDKQSWDDSVKSLTATPSVLSMMSAKLDWTEKLGDAVLAQQPDVMDAIQRLRTRAQANNKLQSTPQQTVTVKEDAGRQIVAIEQADPNTVYVPQYDPNSIYGEWPYPAYPPYYFGSGYYGGAVLAGAIGFGAGYLIGRWANGNHIWGGGLNWGNRNIVANRSVNINNVGANWQHNPAHRQGVRYGNANVQQRFGNNNLRSGSQQRMDFRGRSGQQVLNPGVGNTGLGDRGTAGDRGVADRGNRGTADRGGGERRNASTPKATNRSSGQRANAGPSNRGASNANRAAPRASAGPRRDTAFGNIQRGGAANMQAQRGRASFSGGASRVAGGGFRGGGGRRSDAALKHDVVLLGRLDNNLGFYRFSYYGSNRAYVGVIAQEVQAVKPEAVVRGRDGYLRVLYDKLGVKFETYDNWVKSGSRIPDTLLH
jgi:hypothetical protein